MQPGTGQNLIRLSFLFYFFLALATPLLMLPTEYTELQTMLSGVHSIMRVELVRVGGARPPPFITFTITSKVAVYVPAQWADTLTLFHLVKKICTLWCRPFVIFEGW
jgi:hypothetical protein